MTRHLRLLLPLILLALTASLWAATTPAEVELSHSLQTKVVTPHMDWGHGYTGGPVRALFLIYSGSYGGEWDQPGTRLREVIELMQRFDITGDAAYFGSTSGHDPWVFHGLKLGEERVEKLLQKPYDLYVIGGFPMDKLPARIQYEIMKPVAAGAGLLYCNGANNEYLAPKRQINPKPAALSAGLPALDNQPAGNVATAFRLGKGRGVWLKYGAHALTPGNEFSYRGLTEYDYRMLLVGRAALWAAGKDGAVEVTSVLDPAGLKVQRLNPEGGKVVLTNKSAAALPVTVSLQLRRAVDGQLTPLPAQKVTLPAGQPTELAVKFPLLRAGDYFLDVVVNSAKGLEASGAGSVNFESATGVAKVTVDQSFYEVGESLQGQVTLRGPVPPGSVVRVRLRDNYDRVLRQQDLKVAAVGNTVGFTYKADAAATIEMRAQATLLDGKEEVDQQETSFTVPKRRHGQFNFVMWDTPRDVLGYYAWRKMEEAGQNICLLGSMGGSPTVPPAVLKATDVSLVPYSTRIMDEKDDNGYMKPVCWNNEPDVTAYVNKIVGVQKLLREQGVFVYSLGDEGVTLGCCVHPACLDTYRQWLQGQYGTIDQLNASWGTTYGSFSEVNLLDPKDNMENAAAKTSPARWYDRQAFARWNLSNYVARYVKAYRELDPQALTGYEGTGGFGDDYDAMLTTNTFYGPYPDLGDDVLRSCYPRDRVRSNWMGYSKTGDALSDAAWRMVMKGMDSIWYWMWDGLGSFWGYIQPSMDFYPATQDVTDEMTPVRRGLGDLILNSQMLHSGLAIFYSVPSALSASLENGRDYIAPRETHDIWTNLTYDLGRDYRYLTSKLLTGGQLTNQEFKVLLLPMSQALSPAEAAAIRKFAEAGGTVIADVRPGIYDGHCKPATPGLLDDLFGIKRTGRGKGVAADIKLQANLGGKPLSVTIPQSRLDTEVTPGTAQALATVDGKPVLLVNKVGQGQAILLNFQLNMSAAADGPTAGSRQLLGALYEYAGVRSAVQMTAPDGGPLPQTETRIWRTGDALMCGLWRRMENAWFAPKGGVEAGAPQAARLTLPGKRHVYDLRAGKYLGQVDKLDTKLRWGRANFFLALPYAVQGVDVVVSSAAPSAGSNLTATVKLQASGKITAKHAVYVEVVDPAGRKPQWGSKPVLLQGGTATVPVPIAYNDQPGKWTVRATELFSGKTGAASWTVK